MLDGHANVGDNVFDFPEGSYRGIGLRAFDRVAGQWLSWWIDGRTPAVIGPPLRGSFADGVGVLTGDDSWNGRPVLACVTWSRTTPVSPHWEQAWSADGGATWETNWISEFTRRA